MTYNVSESNSESLDQVCILHKAFTGETDEIGNPVRDTSGAEVFCAELSVGGLESDRAGKRGIKAEIELLIDSESYDGERKVIYNGVQYDIYRHYRRKDGLTELYLTQRSGY